MQEKDKIVFTLFSVLFVKNETCFPARLVRLLDYRKIQSNDRNSSTSYLEISVEMMMTIGWKWIIIYIGITFERKKSDENKSIR